MSPKIATQFRGLEDSLGIQERMDRINFVGSDISPTVDVDPGTASFGEATTEQGTVTGPATLISFASPAPGFFHAYTYIVLNHTDAVARDSRIIVRNTSAVVNHVIRQEVSLAGGLFMPQVRQVIIPAGFRLQAEVVGLAAPFTATMVAMRRVLALGRTIPSLG